MSEKQWGCKTALGNGKLHLHEMRSESTPGFSTFGKIVFSGLQPAKSSLDPNSKFVISLQRDAKQKNGEVIHAQLQGKWVQPFGRSEVDNRPVRDLFGCHHANELLEGETHITPDSAIVATCEVLSRAIILYKNGAKVNSGVMLQKYGFQVSSKDNSSSQKC